MSTNKKVDMKVDKRLTSTDILREIRNNNTYSSGIAKRYGISRQAIQKRLKDLETYGYIEVDIKEGLIIYYKLTPKGLEESKKHKMKLSKRKPKMSFSHRSIKPSIQPTEVYIHAFRIKLPLISDNSDNFWEEESDLAYGKKYYKKLDDITLEKVFSSLIIHFRFPIESLTSKEFDEKFESNLNKELQEITELLTKNNIMIDSEIKKDTMIEFAINDPLTQTLRQIGARIGEFIDLKRLREKIFKEGLDQKAYAKFDSTPEKFTRETNDRLYLRKVLDMPEILDKMGKEFTPAIKKLTEQIELHLAVQQNTLKAQDETVKTMESIRKNLELLPKEDGYKIWKRMKNNIY